MVNQKNCIRKYRKHRFLLKKGLPASVPFNGIWEWNINQKTASQFLSIPGHFQQPKETHLHGVFIPYHPTEIPWYSWYFTTISDGILPPLNSGGHLKPSLWIESLLPWSPSSTGGSKPAAEKWINFQAENTQMGYEHVGNPGYHKQLPWLGMVGICWNPTHKTWLKIASFWGWFMALGLPH